MRTCLAVLAIGLSTATAVAKPEIRDVQAAYGKLGPERKSTEYVPGDEVFYRFTLAGPRTDADGRFRGELRLILTDAKGKVVFRRELAASGKMALGGDTVPSQATVELPLSIPAGEYGFDVEFADLIAGEKAATRQTFTVKAPEFALVTLRFYLDEEGQAPARVGGLVGQNLCLRADAVGYDRSRDEIDLDFEILVLDRDGKPVSPKPIRVAFHREKADEVKMADRVNFSSKMTLNRPGEFRLRIALTDKQTKKNVVFETPLRVEAP